jgi:beta-lactamase class C
VEGLLDDVPALLADAGLPGLSLAWTTGAGRDTETRQWGMASTADDRPVTSTTVCRAGSISKPVTTVLAARLADAGRLDPDADVNEVLTSIVVGQRAPTTTARRPRPMRNRPPRP